MPDLHPADADPANPSAPVSAEHIVADIRSRIVSGELRPGARLPNRLELEKRYSAASMTVQRAFTRLAQDGFIVAAGRQGTFVAERPPHANRYILAISALEGAPNCRRFWSNLARAARVLSERGRVQLDVYHGVSPDLSEGDYATLKLDLARRRLAGLIFASDVEQLKDTPALRDPQIPRVAFMAGPSATGIPAVSLGGNPEREFFGMAVERLAALGRKRIALVAVPGLVGQALGGFRRALASRGLTSHERWIQVITQEQPQWLANLVPLLLHGPAGERPDGLILADDHLADAACAGLKACGLMPGRDLDVVAHANFPLPAATALPLIRLGYDIPGALLKAVELLDCQRQGLPAPPQTCIDPVFREGAAALATLPP